MQKVTLRLFLRKRQMDRDVEINNRKGQGKVTLRLLMFRNESIFLDGS